MTEFIVEVDGRPVNAGVEGRDEGAVVRIDGREIALQFEAVDATTWRVLINGTAQMVRTITSGGVRWVHADGITVAARVGAAVARRTAGREGPEGLEAPMPGAVTRVEVAEGDVVTLGQPVVIVEAMKMELVIRAPHPGRVLKIRVRAGDQVEAGAVVADLGPA